MTASTPELEFAARFAQAWSKPTPEGLVAILHDDVVLYQPHQPPIRGKAAALKELGRLLHHLPGLHGEVDRASGANGVVFIEWRMILPDGGKGVRLPAVDRFFVQDGLGRERVVYFDQLALMAALLRHPRLLARFARYRFLS